MNMKSVRCKVYGLARIILMCLNASFSIAQLPGGNFFNSNQVHDIYINFSQPAYWDSLVYYKQLSDNEDSNVYLSTTVTIDSQVLNMVGIRFKGNSSYYNYPTNKKPFKLDFNHFVFGKNLMALKN